MFNWDKMSLTQRLIWLKNRSGGKSPGRNELATVMGYLNEQISFPDAVDGRRIKMFKEYGNITGSSSQTPTSPRDLVSVNGPIKVRKNSSTGADEFYGSEPQIISVHSNDGSLIYQIAGVENILSLSNIDATAIIKDEQEFITGSVTHRIGIKALNGSENIKKWTPSGASTPTFLIGFEDKAETRVYGLCTHFVTYRGSASVAPDNSFLDFDSKNVGIKTSMFASVDEFKTWLSEQRATEHPVIVTYLLAEEKIETVPGNVISIIGGGGFAAANNSNTQAEIQYYKRIYD